MIQPTLYNMPGSLTLKSDIKMEYSQPTMTNKWHVKNESHPEDFLLWSGEKPNLHQSTYKILGKQLQDSSFDGITESKSKQDSMFQMKNDWRERRVHRRMIDLENFDRIDSMLIKKSSSAYPVLPTHAPGHKQQITETTYRYDYKSRDPSFKVEPVKQKPEFENTWAHRRMISQFSDIDAPKREGINTFHIQHGIYPNQKLKNLIN